MSDQHSNSSSASTEKKSNSVNEQTNEFEIGQEIEKQAVEDTGATYKQVWSKKLLWTAYIVLIVAAFVETFAGDSTSGLNSYATSSFNAHSLITTAAVVYKITAIISYPFMAKLNDVFGRAEGFGFSVLLYTLSYVLYASCQNVQTYVCAEIFYAIGRIGYRVFQQVFIADTTSLINRGFWSSFPDALAAVPSLYVGSVIQEEFEEGPGWRWGYGVWAIIMFASCIALTGMMLVLDRAAKKSGVIRKSAIMEGLPQGSTLKKVYYFFFIRLDIVGAALLLAGLALFFVPLTLTGTSSSYKWHEGKLIAMLVVGFVIFCVFLYWNSRVAKIPFVPHTALLKKTMILACLLVAMDLCENSAFSTYMKTVLQVSKYVSLGEATRIDDSKKACVQIFSVVGGVLMKYTKRTKIFIVTGIPLLYLGHALLVHFINTDGGVDDRGLLYMAEVFIGVGRGIYQTALQVSVQGIAGKYGIAMSTAFFLAFNSVGSLIGSCVAGGIWNTVVLQKLNKYLPAADQADAEKIYGSLKVALKYKEGTAERDAIARAYRETQQIIGWATLGVITPMLILMWFVDNVHLTENIDIYEPSEKASSVNKELIDRYHEDAAEVAIEHGDEQEVQRVEKAENAALNVQAKPTTTKEKLIWLFGL